ncbi:MAG TPA: alpha-ketoacid dehydrogenase subunit beta, partial [Tetragenococcus sp.]|nr:alpha-ketoacid dehydrogenase subunit beta [Tetragenococcus sp.]
MTRKITFMKAINEALEQEMEQDEKVFLIGEDQAGGATVKHLEEKGEDAFGGVFGVTTGLVG